MNIKLLSREEIVANWPYLQSQFQKAMDHGQGESTTIDYLQKLLNYQVRTLNQSEMLQVSAAVGVHVQTQFAKVQL